jgi:hypothetical protein
VRSGGGLRVVSAYGFTGGTTVLNRDGLLEVVLEQPAGGTFSYVIADPTGATSTAEVTVLAATSPTSTPPTTTVAPATTSPATTVAPTPTGEPTPSTTSFTPTPIGDLPATGSSPWHAVRVALVLLALGTALVGVAWSTRRRPTAR